MGGGVNGAVRDCFWIAWLSKLDSIPSGGSFFRASESRSPRESRCSCSLRSSSMKLAICEGFSSFFLAAGALLFLGSEGALREELAWGWVGGWGGVGVGEWGSGGVGEWGNGG